MKKTLHFILALLISVTAFAQGTGEVIITEIYNRPLKPDAAILAAAIPNNPTNSDGTTPNEGHTEWFEVYNTTSSPVVMDGWLLIDESNGATTTIGTFTIAANSYAAFSGFNIPDAQGGVVFDYFYDYKAPSFNNETSYDSASDSSCPDGVSIYKADGITLVDTVEYDYGYNVASCLESQDTDHDFPAQGGNSKISFQLYTNYFNATDNDLPSSWGWSTATYDATNSQKGTPGTANLADPTASVKDDGFSNYFSLYPNPASGFINIQSKTVEVTKVEMFNLTGQRVLEQKGLVKNGVDVSGLSKGIYILKLSSADNQFSRKIVIE